MLSTESQMRAASEINARVKQRQEILPKIHQNL